MPVPSFAGTVISVSVLLSLKLCLVQVHKPYSHDFIRSDKKEVLKLYPSLADFQI